MRRVLLQLGYSESIYDPCLFILQFFPNKLAQGAGVGCAGLVLLDVDDFAHGGGPRHQSLIEKLDQRCFRFGKWRIIYKDHGEYLGKRFASSRTSKSALTCSATSRKSFVRSSFLVNVSGWVMTRSILTLRPPW